MNKSAQGFTLIELSIVLVIIGLIIGGVLVGRDLIKAAKIRNAVSAIEQYETAINTFRVKYNYLPGDLARATSFLGASSDGDGNGIIDRPGALDANTSACASSEFFAANEHLARAGLIKLAAFNATDNTNCTINKGWIDVMGRRGYASDSGWVSGGGIMVINTLSGMYTVIGGSEYDNTVNYSFHVSALRPYEAWIIDTKIDDGMPRSGAMWNQLVLTNGVKNDWTYTSDGDGDDCHTSSGGQYIYLTSDAAVTNNINTCVLFKKPSF